MKRFLLRTLQFFLNCLVVLLGTNWVISIAIVFFVFTGRLHPGDDALIGGAVPDIAAALKTVLIFTLLLLPLLLASHRLGRYLRASKPTQNR